MSGSSFRLLGGIVMVTIDNDVWNAVDAVEYRPTFATREILKGQSAVEGFSEIPESGLISMTLRDRGDATVSSLNRKTAAEVVIQAANGKTISGFPMCQTGDIKVATKEGTFSITFEGPNVTEQTA
jgi:hypothetical protein